MSDFLGFAVLTGIPILMVGWVLSSIWAIDRYTDRKHGRPVQPLSTLGKLAILPGRIMVIITIHPMYDTENYLYEDNEGDTAAN